MKKDLPGPAKPGKAHVAPSKTSGRPAGESSPGGSHFQGVHPGGTNAKARGPR